MRHVLFLLGVEDSNYLTVRSILPNGLDYVANGNIDLYQDLRHPALSQHMELLGGRMPVAPRVRRPDIVFNCITNADTNRKTLGLAATAVQALGVPVINAPEHVLVTRRDEIATRLADIPAVTMPRTVRIRAESHRQILDALDQGPVRYPALLRRAGTHGGVSMLLLRSAADAPLLERIACDGTEYYLTEFVDFRSNDSYYRKIRIVMVDGKPYIRHQFIGQDWNLHVNSRSNNAVFARDEEDFLARFDSEVLPSLRDRLDAIQQRVALDYYSIDGAIQADGSLLVFEANASGNALRHTNQADSPYRQMCVEKLRAAVFDMLLRPRPS